MWDVLVYPFVELAMLLLFCHGIPRRQLGERTAFLAAVSLIMYMLLRYYLISAYDAAILILRILFFAVLCCEIYDISWKNSAFLSACLSLFLHVVIVFYYNVPFLSRLVRQWPFGDLILINLLRAALVLSLSKTVAEAAHARIGPTECLLVFVSYLGYLFDIRAYVAVMTGQASPLQTTIVLFMYCLATTLSVIAAMWHIVSRSRQNAVRHMEEVLQQQYLVWSQKAERDAAISRMYHDLKRQINLIGSLESGAAQELTRTLKESVEAYSGIPDTGSAILNTLLGEKAQQCRKMQIAFQCVTQFQSLEPLQGLDICAIVGNAVDNAIEACERMSESAQREIELRILQTDAFLAFKFENTYSGELHSEHGRLLTSKADAEHHGIGLDSIRYSAKKYGGEVTIDTTPGRFTLKVLIPTPA